MRRIPLTRGQFALVDDEDFEGLSLFKWYAAKFGNGTYAVRNPSRKLGKRKLILLHNFLMGGRTDHIDGDGLNNQRYNLRRATVKQNTRAYQKKSSNTTSIFRGVSFCRATTRWRASIVVDRKSINLGRHDSQESAARAYDEAAKKHFGEFACPNFKL